MRHDNPFGIYSYTSVAQRFDDVFVGQPVETKASKPFILKRTRQARQAGNGRQITMERRVKAGDLSEIGSRDPHRIDPGNIGGKMQGGKRRQLLQSRP